MVRGFIAIQEGRIVYINHRIPGTTSGERGVRGVVYQSRCYDIEISSTNENDPTCKLGEIDENLVLDVKPIPYHEQGVLEREIAKYCQKYPDSVNRETKIRISIEMLLSLSRYEP